MRIGFLTTEYIVDGAICGGQANYLRRLCMGLAKRGHEVHVFLLSHKTQSACRVDEVFVHYVGAQADKLLQPLNRLTRGKLQRSFSVIAKGLAAAWYIKSFQQRTPLDVMQVASFRSPGLFLPLFCRLPTVIRVTSYSPLLNRFAEINRTFDTRLVEWLEGQHWKMADAIYSPSDWLARLLEKEIGFKNVAVIRTPFYRETTELDYTWYDAHLAGKEYLLYFGLLQAHKGVHILAEALKRVWRQMPELNAVFVGANTRRANGQMMRAQIEQSCQGHQQRLLVVDPLAHPQLYPVIENARLVALPSICDNFPNAMLEALGAAKPLIGTYGNGFDEVLQDNYSGFLVKPGDAEELAEKICAAWRHPDLENIGRRGAQSVEALQPQLTLEQVERFYQKTMLAAAGQPNKLAAHPA